MSKDQEKILSSQNLHKEWTEEREKQGLKAMPAINPGQAGSTNTYCQSDKSYKNAFDFFRKNLKKK